MNIRNKCLVRNDPQSVAQVRCDWAPDWTEPNSHSYWLKETQVQSFLKKTSIVTVVRVQLLHCPHFAILAQDRCDWAPGWTEPNSPSYWVKEAQAQSCLDKSEL